MSTTPPELSVAQQRSAVIARVYREWAAEHGDVQPENEFLVEDNEPSQYAEGITALSAGREADETLDARINAALEEAGIPFPTA